MIRIPIRKGVLFFVAPIVNAIEVIEFEATSENILYGWHKYGNSDFQLNSIRRFESHFLCFFLCGDSATPVGTFGFVYSSCRTMWTSPTV